MKKMEMEFLLLIFQLQSVSNFYSISKRKIILVLFKNFVTVIWLSLTFFFRDPLDQQDHEEKKVTTAETWVYTSLENFTLQFLNSK